MRTTINILLLLLVSWGVLPAECFAQPGQVSANGITIAYESFGSRNDETVLLIAGTNSQLTMWPVEFCNQLVGRGYRVIRFDNRDIGLSTKFDKAGLPDFAAISKALQEKKTPPLPYTLDDMADDAAGLLSALTINKAHIVGGSMGGMIAQRVAYNHPERTSSLASIFAGGGKPAFPLLAKPSAFAQLPVPGPATDTAAYINREIQTLVVIAGPVYPPNPEKARNQVTANVRRSYYPDGSTRQGAASIAGFFAGREAQLRTIRVPTVVIHGTEDPIVAVEAGQDVAATIPGARFELIPGMGHDISDELIGRLVDLIVENASKSTPK